MRWNGVTNATNMGHGQCSIEKAREIEVFSWYLTFMIVHQSVVPAPGITLHGDCHLRNSRHITSCS